MKKIKRIMIIIILIILIICVKKINVREHKKIILVGKVVALTSEDNYNIESESVDGNIRTSLQNIGIMTCIDEETNQFVTLGHGIYSNNELIPIKSGICYKASDMQIKKCTDNEIGSLRAEASYDEKIGNLSDNTNIGIYGNITNSTYFNKENEYEVAYEYEVKTGKAEIYVDLFGIGLEKYEIEIEKLNYFDDSKNIYIKVTDERLFELAGGIVKGMSGSPIIQNGKLIGAVNYSSEDDFSKGCGIFADKLFK